MEDNLEFIYKKETWFISAILNSEFVDHDNTAKEIEKLIIEKVQNLTDEDLKKIGWNKEWVEKVKELGKNLSIKCEWKTSIDSFPYSDENYGFNYNTLGYFEFDCEYYPDEPKKKDTIETPLLQQIPIVILNELKEFSKKKENKYLYLDLESPIYLFVSSDETRPDLIQWTKENIQKHKRVIGNWTEVYSGQWPDYNDELYKGRVRDNLSNRLSELHFIRRNSGFIYMAQENYKLFYNSYMKEFVITPTAEIRSILFSLMAVNRNLDILQVLHLFMDRDIIEKKMLNLRLLRGVLQIEMSVIYNELGYNRRQHYTAVLTKLLDEFNLEDIIKRINEKIDVIHDSMQVRYQKLNEENQKKTQRGVRILNLLFISNVIIDIASLVASAFVEINLPLAIFQWSVAITSIGLLFAIIINFIYMKFADEDKKIRRAVDGVVTNKEMNKVVLIIRKFPPYAGQYALPGGFVEKGENQKEAVIREVKEETNLDVKVIDKVGHYDKEGRDPRGKIVSTAYLCIITGDISKMKISEETSEIIFIPVEKLKHVNLAFDHEDIISDAFKFKEDS